MRNAFIQELVRQAENRPEIVLVVGDLGYSVVEPFADRFPARFFNAGVAEQDMMGMAAGLASEGFRPFVYSIANFPVFRCAEQIRNDVAYHRFPVTIVTVGGGLAYGNLGYSHHAIQDYGLLRLFPHMLIAAPGDPMEVRACVRHLLDFPQPAYLRLGKAGEPEIHDSVPELAPGRWLQLKPGAGRRTLLSTGATLDLARSWLGHPDYSGYALHSLPLWGMDCKRLQAGQLSAWDEVVTIEDHLADGGFGSWMREAQALQENGVTQLRCKALDASVCDIVGGQAALNAWGGLRP